MDDAPSVFVSKKEACRLVGLSVAQVDRLRRLEAFPDAFELTGARNGKVGFLRHEVLDWTKSRRRRTLTPPPDSSD